MLPLGGCAARNSGGSVPPSAKDWTITLTFNYDFTNFVPCSSTVTKGCITGFTWGYLQGTTPVPLKTSPASVCSGTTQPESCTDTTNALLGIGPVTFYAQANGVDNNGNAVTSPNGVSSPSNVALMPATNVAAALK